VLAILVSIYPEAMLNKTWFEGLDADHAEKCSRELLRLYCSSKREIALFNTIFSYHMVWLQPIIVAESRETLPMYIRPETIHTVIAYSRTAKVWG
jgi:hypothetical protein